MGQEESKNCIWCSESIKISASVCFHCNRHQNKLWELFHSVSPLISIIMMVLAVLSFLAAHREQVTASRAVDEVRIIANKVIKISHVLADGSVYFDGMPQEHLDKIKEYQIEMEGLLDPEINQQIKDDIYDITDKINKKKKD